jgi:hypothetical protein
MEFKVDVREILAEEDIDEEHRANVLGGAWAKGERQGIEEAVEFVNSKLEEGILTEAAAERMIKVIRGYTTRR